MGRLFFNLILCCACFIVASCSNEVTIGGTAEKANVLSLYSFDNGEVTLLQSAPVDKENGTFQLTVELPYEGLYLMGSNEQALYPLYLMGGDIISAEYKDNRLSLTGEMSEENQVLFKWENKANDTKIDSFLYNFLPGENSVGYEEFFRELEDLAAHKEAMLKELEGKKGNFYKLLVNKINADLDFYALSYLRAFGWDIPDTVNLPAYYENMQPDTAFQNPAILELPYAGKMLDTYIWYLGRNQDKASAAKETCQYSLLNDKNLQQEYLITSASCMKYYDEYESLLQQCGADFFTEPYKSRISRIGDALAWSKPGIEAFDFQGVAPDSSIIKLSDYKGKVVVVDVWATWCEPCRRMMPLFHEMQKEFKGENVVFLSVCVGVWVEMDKWIELSKEFHIKENNLFI